MTHTRNSWGRKKILAYAGAISFALLVPANVVRITPSIYAQVTTGTIGGTVTDTTGAVVPGATVVLKNAQSGDTRQVTSNGAGVFTFSAVPSGDYLVAIKAAGFKQYQQKGIHVDPGDTRTIREIALQPGDVSQTVEVSTTANTIDTDSGEQSALISSEEIKHLAVEGRDVTELLKILPGFAISKGGAGNFDNSTYDPSQVNPTGALGQYAANGTPVNGQALLSDGVDITDPGAFGGALQNVNYDWVAEVKVQTSSFTADTAHGPIVINAVGKSGGSSYHGSLYTYARTTQLNSTDWIAKYTSQAKPPDRFVYPGFTFGGPVLIPGTNFNHNKKLTFFVGAEDYAQRNVYAYGSASNATLTALVPTANMRKGIFNQTELQSYLGNQYQVNPTGACGYYNGPSPAPNPYPINGGAPDRNICQVPSTAPDGSAITNGDVSKYLDPLSSIILNELPLPNTPSNGTYNWITTNLVNNNLWEAHGRFDLAVNDNNKVFGTYTVEKGVGGVPQNEYYSARGNLGGVNIPGGGLLSPFSSHTAALNYAHIFSSSATNELYAAGAYFSQSFVDKTPSATQNNPYQGVYLNGSTVQPTLEDYGNDGLPLLRTPDTTFGGIFAKKQVRIAGDNFTKVIGKHALRAGIFYQWDSNPQISPFINTNGTINLYYFGSTFNDPVKGTVYTTGNYLANFAEGQVFGYNQTNIAPEPNLYFWNLAEYVQDHYRLTQRISVDAGVRFEHMTPWQDSHNLGVAVFTDAAYKAGINPNLPGFQWHGINKDIPNGGRPTRWAFVEPRLGFAWDILGTGSTLLRGGFGIYRAHDSYNDAANENGTVLGKSTFNVNGPINLSSISYYQSQASKSGAFVPDGAAYGFDPTDDEEPRVRTYNLSVDQRLPLKLLLEIAYVGNSSDKLMNDGSTQNTTLDDLNSLPIGSLFGPQPNSRTDTSGTAGTVFPIFPDPKNTSNNNSVGGLQQAVIDSYKKYALYNHVYVPEHNTYSNYNALQVAITRQVGRAHFNVNYTWSKALGILGIGGSATYSYPADPFNYSNDYSFLPFDRRNIFNASYSYDFGKLVQNRFVGAVTNGWELSGISTYQGGQHLPSTINSNFGLNGTISVPIGAVASVDGNTSTCQFNPSANNTNCSFSVSSQNLLGTPDVNLQPTIIASPQVHNGQHQYINSAAFGLPQLGTNGAYRYGYLPGPGYFETDLTASKNFALKKGSVQVRLAAFNFINHANSTFTAVNNQNYTLNFNGSPSVTDLNQALAMQNGSQNNQFGFAPLREGRRILELSLRYDF